MSLLLLTGCTAGGDRPAPVPPHPTQQQSPAPHPIKPLAVTREGAKVIVQGLKNWTVFPASDGSALAFETADGIWAIEPTGGNLRQWVSGNRVRKLIDLTGERLLYLERQGDDLLVLKAEPGKEPVQLATVTARHLHEQGPIPAWTDLQENRLTLAVYKEPLMQVELATGAVKSLGTEPLSILIDYLIPTPDRRYLLQKREYSRDPARLYDLETGRVTQPQGEFHIFPRMSPAENRYAVLAAEVGSGLPSGVEGNWLEGGTHLDVVQPDGSVRHLHPPEPLKVLGGPDWSPDGTKLAIQSNQASGPVWLVDVASGQWTPITIPVAGSFSGWHDAEHILVFDGPDKLYKLPVTGGIPEPLPLVNGQVSLSDGTLVYRPHDITARDSVWVRRPGEPDGMEVLGGDGTYDQLIPMGTSVAVVNHRAGEYRLIILFAGPWGSERFCQAPDEFRYPSCYETGHAAQVSA